MTRQTRLLLPLIVLVVFTASTSASAPTYLYQAKLVQAAPGKLLDVIDLYKSALTEYKNAGDEQPLMIRHSQGDHWDLLLLIPMKSYADYYTPGRVSKRRQVLKESQDKLDALISWQEDVFVYGPPLPELQKAFASSAFFHVEMFDALAGKQSELFREREMENSYLKALKRPENLIFVRDQGASWDLFTIGTYRDLKHFAESAGIPETDQDAAAKAAGFEAANRIGPYLRTLISSHHDTLAVNVK
ncbi:MAG TPA: hypothetical protein VKB46_12685 [Pyrinomonadaceae bacterium]|nr:hypothetical protein [Pyrinomonadaceae bacterium]